MPAIWRPHAATFLTFIVAIAFGFVLSRLQVPLPWMIGPMLLTAAVEILRPGLKVPHFARSIGQMIVAASVGLAFTPAALSSMIDKAPVMIASALLTIVAGLLVAAVLMRLSRTDVVSACLASIPMGPAETATLASAYGVAPGPIVFTQTLRIAFIVLTVPPIMVALNGTGFGLNAVTSTVITTWPGSALLMAAALTGGFVFKILRVTSPFFLGALACSAACAALELPVSAFPFPLIAFGQVLLGFSLGAIFDRNLFRETPRFLIASSISTALLLSLCATMAFAIAYVADIPWPAMILATAPGSVTEMALTAKILATDVATVTAFHVVRIFITLPLAPLLFRLTARIAKRVR